MAARKFDDEYVRQADEGPRRSAKVIRCGACPTTEMAVSRGADSLPNEMVQAKFSRMGWHIGRRPVDDRCPACLEKERLAKRKTSMDKTNLKAVPATPKPATVTALGEGLARVAMGTPPAAEKPREMSREDGRIIFDKLSTLYDDNGYIAGWSDKRVAEDLGIPRAWVENVRAQFYGDSAGNDQAETFLKACDALRADVATFSTERAEFLKRVDKLAEALANLLREATAIKKAMGL